MRTPGVVAIVPMKPLAMAKSRLSGELTPPLRMALCLNLLRRVLRAIVGPGLGILDDAPVDSLWVVGGDPDICQVAREEGASWYEEEGSNINDTLGAAFQMAHDSGTAALYLPGDLPLLKPQDIYGMVGASGHLTNVILAPSRQGGGTNGILVPAGLPQPFSPLLGSGSFWRHLAQAASLRLPMATYYSQGLAFDVDTYDDLKACEYMEPGLLEKLTQGENPVQGK